jgi:hypothetical protein
MTVDTGSTRNSSNIELTERDARLICDTLHRSRHSDGLVLRRSKIPARSLKPLTRLLLFERRASANRPQREWRRERLSQSVAPPITATHPSKIPLFDHQRDADSDSDESDCRTQASRCDTVNASADNCRCFVHGATFLEQTLLVQDGPQSCRVNPEAGEAHCRGHQAPRVTISSCIVQSSLRDMSSKLKCPIDDPYRARFLFPNVFAAPTFVITKKRPPYWRPSPIKVFSKRLCDAKGRTVLFPPICHEADTAETEDHHRPGRGFGDGRGSDYL